MVKAGNAESRIASRLAGDSRRRDGLAPLVCNPPLPRPHGHRPSRRSRLGALQHPMHWERRDGTGHVFTWGPGRCGPAPGRAADLPGRAAPSSCRPRPRGNTLPATQLRPRGRSPAAPPWAPRAAVGMENVDPRMTTDIVFAARDCPPDRGNRRTGWCRAAAPAEPRPSAGSDARTRGTVWTPGPDSSLENGFYRLRSTRGRD